MARIWLWRPRPSYKSPVKENSYRCCCWLLPAPGCFPVYNYLMGLFAMAALIQFVGICYFAGTIRIIHPTAWLFLFGSMAMIGLGVRASKTLRPIYMQLYLIPATIVWLIVLAGCLALLIATLSLPRTQYERPDFLNALTRNVEGTVTRLVITMFIIVLQAHFTYSYYFYLRDRQLEIEEKHLELQNPFLISPKLLNREYLQVEMDDVPPPPYQP